MKGSAWSLTSSRARKGCRPKTFIARTRRDPRKRSLLFARPEPRHHEGPERAAPGECGKGLSLPFERKQHGRESARDEDERSQRQVLKIESHDVGAAIGRAAARHCSRLRPAMLKMPYSNVATTGA